MCGILGTVSVDRPPLAPARLAGLLDLLAHRGPDDRGVAGSGAATFGHTRLSILGPGADTARQPAVANGDLLAFNGEIYNYRSLVAELRQRGIACSGASDTEALFLALRHWGVERTLAVLDGMFAFAFYDSRPRRLHLVRDALGEKPLYWARGKGRLWFASEAKALVNCGEVDPAPNLARLDEYFYSAKIAGAETMFRDVVEVEPGTRVEIEADGGVSSFAWWRIEDDGPEAAGDYSPTIVAGFAERLADAVRSRRISDVPIGVLLSGGIDSNTIAALLLDDQPAAGFDCFFADNADARVSERADTELFVAHARRRHPSAELRVHARVSDFSDYMAKLERLTWYYDEPVQFYNSPLLSGLCESARREGLKVLVSGEGSDEILYGYDRFRRTSERLRGATTHQERISELYFGGGRHSVDVVRDITAGVAEGAETSSAWIWLDHNLERWPIDVLQMRFSQKFRLQMLLQRQDRVGMSHGIEIRVPFLQPALVRWVNALPMDAKYDSERRRTKRVLRDAMREHLPERILTKAKDGFPSDMSLWLGETQVEEIVRDLTADPHGFVGTYLDRSVVRRALDGHFAGFRRLDMIVWHLLALEIWHRSFGHRN